MGPVRYLPRTTPLGSALGLTALRRVGGPKNDVAFPTGFSPSHAARGATDGAHMWEVVRAVAFTSWKPHRNQWNHLLVVSIIEIQTFIGQKLNASSKLGGRLSRWIVGLVVVQT